MQTEIYNRSFEHYNINALIVVESLQKIYSDIEEDLVVEKSDKFTILKVPDYLASEIPSQYLAVISFNEFCDLLRQGQIVKINYIKLHDIDPAQLPAEFWKLRNLKALSLHGIGFETLSPKIEQLTNLQSLNLSYNNLSTLPVEVGRLANLTSLDLSSNRLVSLPAEIVNLRKLTHLNLGENALGIPPEILHNEPQTILNYLSWVIAGEKSLNETKMLMVGQGSVGKTSLIKRLTQEIFDFKEFKTDGIAISYWQVLDTHKFKGNFQIKPEDTSQDTETSIISGTEDILETEDSSLVISKRSLETGISVLFEPKDNLELKSQTNLSSSMAENQEELQPSKTAHVIDPNKQHIIRLNIWDFGGQEIMHATHQFFLTKRSLYVLVLDSRLTQEENRVEYWLKIIQSFSDESPVLIVGNKIDQHPLDIDRTGLQKKYPNIVGILETSAATGAGIETLKAAITEQVNNLPHVRDLLPEAWFTVKTKLEELGRQSNFITHDKYLELCAKNEVSDETSQRTLIGFLHDLGVVLHFQDDPRLEALGILNPQWVTNGVYKILNSHELFQNKGVLALAMLNSILNIDGYPRDKRLFIVDMMKKFELCYEMPYGYDIEADKIFLVPDLLPKDEPAELKFNGVPAFEYVYPVLPSSVITRFIVRMNQKIENHFVWRTGVVLKIGENLALVKADIEDRKITIAIDGLEHTRRDALSAIRYQLDEIHGSIKGLDAQKRVPIPDAPNAEPLDYDYLLQLEQDGFEEHPVKNGNRLVKVNVKKLLSGVVSENERRQSAGNTTNIYIGGDVKGGTIIAGDENEVNKK